MTALDAYEVSLSMSFAAANPTNAAAQFVKWLREHGWNTGTEGLTVWVTGPDGERTERWL